MTGFEMTEEEFEYTEELKKESEECMHNALYWLKLPISKENVEQGGSYILKLLEPREKQIAELEDKLANADYQLEGRDLEIKDLKKENAELKNKLEHRNCLDCSNHSSNLRMRNLDLEKENAELKKQLEMSNKVYNDNLDYSHHIEEHLTEAKSLLASWISDKPYTKSELKDLIADTEQFLKDCEVEK